MTEQLRGHKFWKFSLKAPCLEGAGGREFWILCAGSEATGGRAGNRFGASVAIESARQTAEIES